MGENVYKCISNGGYSMNPFNLSTRVVMFAICSSLEYDLKKFILDAGKNVDFTKQMLDKARFREKKLNDKDQESVINQLDLGDYVSIITNVPYDFNINNQKAKQLENYFEKIIPVRNRVMHTKPLELGDRAILTEVLEKIELEIDWLKWSETNKTKGIISTDPSQLVGKMYPRIIEYNPKVYNNLPTPEFDDTGYIGRKREIKEIKELIQNKKNQIITIVGNGGIGKTAITVKSLYDLIDDNCIFDAIIWISLKTRTLSKGDFVAINDSIQDISELYKEGSKLAISDEGLSPRDNLLKFLGDFNVLLVLDNLETINNEDINSFLKQIPENSKVVITSRHGLGELEYRYVLDGMSPLDSVLYFRELSKYYGLDIYKKSDEEINRLVLDHLYSNPLSIKWYISGIFSGLDENSLLANKDKLVEFCMSNVFSKLSINSKRILQLFLVENKELTLGEIDYFIEIDDVELRISVNELLSTNMVKLNNKYIINDMARDYLSIYHPPSNDFVMDSLGKRKKLNIMLQDIRVKSEKDPFSPRSLFANMNDENRKLSSYYLIRALEFSSERDWQKAYKYIEKAGNISPDYFEVYKIKAFISAEKNELFDAINNYKIAISKCNDLYEKASVLFLFSVFYVIKLSEYDIALELILQAEKYRPDELQIQLEKSRILMYLGKYEEAEDILKIIDKRRGELDSKTVNIFVSRYADLFRRQAANFQLRDAEKKVRLFEMGINQFNKIDNIDYKTCLILIKLLKDLSFLYFHEKAMELLIQALRKHYKQLESIKHKDYRRLKDIIISHQYEVPNNLFSELKKYVSDVKLEANHIYEPNQGIIVHMHSHYGFIGNAQTKGIYFSVSSIQDDAGYGDKVQFEVYKNKQGQAARNVRKVK